MMMPLLVPLLLSRKKRVRSTALFTTEESTFDLLMMSMFSLFSSRRKCSCSYSYSYSRRLKKCGFYTGLERRNFSILSALVLGRFLLFLLHSAHAPRAEEIQRHFFLVFFVFVFFSGLPLRLVARIYLVLREALWRKNNTPLLVVVVAVEYPHGKERRRQRRSTKGGDRNNDKPKIAEESRR